MIDAEFVNAVAELATKAEAIQPIEAKTYVPAAWVGGKIVSLEEFAVGPSFKRANVTLIKPDDFCAYVNRHKEEATEMVASNSGLSVRCVIDGLAVTLDDSGFGRHVVTLQLKEYDDWSSWQKSNGKRLSQTEFGSFIESMQHTIEEPDAAKLLDLIQTFSYVQVRTFEKPKFDEQSGAMTINYQDDRDQKGTIKLPPAIYASASPFVGAKPVRFEAKLRFRPGGDTGAPVFYYEIIRLDRFREEAFDTVLQSIEAATGVRPLLGP